MMNANRLRALVAYNPETGLFTSRVKRHLVSVGQTLGGLDAKGYVRIKLDGKFYKAHRLAFLYVTGEWPSDDVDHEDRNKSNNRWGNIRDAGKSVNGMNKGPSVTCRARARGVYPIRNTTDKVWAARKQGVYLGCFRSITEAQEAYNAK
jgi:hypothetical protein